MTFTVKIVNVFLRRGHALLICGLIAACVLIPSNQAHRKQPGSPEELEKALAERRLMYHCFPEISVQLTNRRAKYLRSGDFTGALSEPSTGRLLDQSQNHQAYETENYYDQNSDSDSTESSLAHHSKEKVLSCSAPEDIHRAKLKKHSCTLSPIVTSGPYYHLSEHPIRQNIAEWQDGLPFLMDIGVIDVDTCEPVEGALVDIWHANATGSYAGHPHPAPDKVNEVPQTEGKRAGLLSPFPRSNFHEKWLRGAWPTNSDGVAKFTSIFPGYYTGRATHVHAKVHLDWKTNPSGTFSSKEVQYVGQFFFDDEINESVDKMSPYRNNPTGERTRNWKDSLNIFEDSKKSTFQGKQSGKNGEEELFDPIFEIEKLGGVINQGLIGFMTVGIKRSNRFSHDWSP